MAAFLTEDAGLAASRIDFGRANIPLGLCLSELAIMGRMAASRAWSGDTRAPIEILVQCGGGILTVAIKVPWFLKTHAIYALDVRLQELFHAIDQMDGRAPSASPVVQSRTPEDCEEDRVTWSREYSDPDYPLQFTHALEAMAAQGIAQWIH